MIVAGVSICYDAWSEVSKRKLLETEGVETEATIISAKFTTASPPGSNTSFATPTARSSNAGVMLASQPWETTRRGEDGFHPLRPLQPRREPRRGGGADGSTSRTKNGVPHGPGGGPHVDSLFRGRRPALAEPGPDLRREDLSLPAKTARRGLAGRGGASRMTTRSMARLCTTSAVVSAFRVFPALRYLNFIRLGPFPEDRVDQFLATRAEKPGRGDFFGAPQKSPPF